jgi:hypothetical protein
MLSLRRPRSVPPVIFIPPRGSVNKIGHVIDEGGTADVQLLR